MSVKSVIALLFVLTLLSGCKSFYQETGVSTTAGDISAPLEVSDSSDIINIRALYSMSGARLWVSRGNAVYMRYRCSTTNEYFKLVDTRMLQETEMAVIPTNASHSVISTLERLMDNRK